MSDEHPGLKYNPAPYEPVHRRWNELLQEMRVMQTGAQIVTAFLVILPFQSRFAELNQYQVIAYVVLLVFSGFVSALLLVPVAIHRQFFGQNLMAHTVRTGHVLVRLALALIALLISSCIIFITMVVLHDVVAWVVGSLAAIGIVSMVVVLPIYLRHRAYLLRQLQQQAEPGGGGSADPTPPTHR